MTWLTFDTIYEGFPLYLRRPDYKNVWSMMSTYPRLFSIEHSLEKVKQNGLPESEYNKSLEDFDYKMCCLFEDTANGIIILIETFAGKRIYYYYVKEAVDLDAIFNQVKKQFKDYKLEMSAREDSDWGLLIQYPVTLYSQ